MDLISRVREAVEGVFGILNPREEITLERLSELVLEVRRRVEGATEEERRYVLLFPFDMQSCTSLALHPTKCSHQNYIANFPVNRIQKWLTYLLPPTTSIPSVLAQSGMPPLPSSNPTPTLQRLIDETSDIIDSPSFTHVLTLLLDAGFSHLIDNRLSQLAFKIPPISDEKSRVVEIVGTGQRAKVASCLAVFCRQASVIGSGGGNEYLSVIEGVRQLEGFSAVVYSSNFEFESPEGVVGVEKLVADEVVIEKKGGGMGMGEQESGIVKDGEPGRGAEKEEDKMELSFEDVWDKALAKEDGKQF